MVKSKTTTSSASKQVSNHRQFDALIKDLISKNASKSEVGKAIGGILATHRQESKASIEELAATLIVNESIIQSIEDGDREKVEKITYYEGCVMAIARFYGFPTDKLEMALMQHDPIFLDLRLNSGSSSAKKKAESGKYNANSTVQLLTIAGASVLLLFALSYYFVHHKNNISDEFTTENDTDKNNSASSMDVYFD